MKKISDVLDDLEREQRLRLQWISISRFDLLMNEEKTFLFFSND